MPLHAASTQYPGHGPNVMGALLRTEDTMPRVGLELTWLPFRSECSKPLDQLSSLIQSMYTRTHLHTHVHTYTPTHLHTCKLHTYMHTICCQPLLTTYYKLSLPSPYCPLPHTYIHTCTKMHSYYTLLVGFQLGAFSTDKGYYSDQL